jgi:hypothetical protein
MKTPYVLISVEVTWGQPHAARHATLTGSVVEITGAIDPRELRALAHLTTAIGRAIEELKQPPHEPGSILVPQDRESEA